MNKCEKIAQTMIDIILNNDSVDIDSVDKHPAISSNRSVSFTMSKEIDRPGLNLDNRKFSRKKPYYREEYSVIISMKKVFFNEDEENP